MTFQKFTTFNEMERWLDENRVTEIECLVPDLTGVARGKILPRNKFSEEKGMRLPEAIFGSTVTGEYPSSDMFDSIIAPTDNDGVAPRSHNHGAPCAVGAGCHRTGSARLF